MNFLARSYRCAFPAGKSSGCLIRSLIQTSYFSTDPEKSPDSRLSNVLRKIKPSQAKIAIGAAGIFFLGTLTAIVKVGEGFLLLTPYTTGYYGFVAGVFCTVIVSYGANKALSLFYLSPITVKKRIVEIMKHDPYVASNFGDDFILSEVSGFKSGIGHLTVVNRSITWNPTYTEIVCGIKGGNCSGIVTAIAVKTVSGNSIKSLCVHMTGQNPRFIVGDADVEGYHSKLAMALIV